MLIYLLNILLMFMWAFLPIKYLMFSDKQIYLFMRKALIKAGAHWLGNHFPQRL